MKRYFSVNHVLFFLLLACQDELAIREYPMVTTLEVNQIDDNGAVFKAQVDNVTDIIDHGFVWDRGINLSLENSRFVSLGKLTQKEFSKSIQSTLERGTAYKVRAYIKTSKKIVYGKEVEFISLGSLGPRIKKLIPNTGAVGDTVMIQGINFNGRKNEIVVTFNLNSASIISSSDSTLKVIVPSSDEINLEVKISLFKSGSQPLAFKLIPANITSVTPMVSLCDTINVFGKNFQKEANIIINGENISILKSTRNKISFFYRKQISVPFTMEIFGGGPLIKLQDPFKQKLPSVESISYLAGDTIVVEGINFPSCTSLMVSEPLGDFNIISTSESLIKIYFKNSFCLTDLAFGASNFIFRSPQIQYARPVLLEVIPNSGTFSDIITIRGKNFISNNVTMIDYFASSQTNANSLINRIPTSAAGGPNGIFLITANNCMVESAVPLKFKLNAPEILSISPVEITSIDEEITISGKNFNQESDNNKVVLFQNNVRIDYNNLTSTSTQIKISPFNFLEEGLPRKETIKIRIETNGQLSNEYPLKFNYQ